MKKNKAVNGIFKVLLLLFCVLISVKAFSQGSAITIPSFPGKSLCDLDFPVNAHPANPAPLLYFSTDESVATVSLTGIIHIVGIGNTTIQAFQAGNPFIASQNLAVTVPPPPNVVIAVDLASVCVGAPVTFTATVSDLGVPPTYQWLVNGSVAGTNSATFTTNTLVSTDAVQCIATIGNCHLTGTSNIISGIIAKSYVTPTITIKPSVIGTICLGSNVSFTAVTTNASTAPRYQWKVNGVNAGSNVTTFSSSTLANGDIVTCDLIASGPGCFAPATVTSNSINISAATAAIGTVAITASTNNAQAGVPIIFTATSTLTATHYQWQVNGANAGTDSKTFTSNTLKTGDAVTCIILISASCTAALTSQSIIMTILPPPAITLTNTFTPNGDGINDVWALPDLGYYPGCNVTIYNRYGTRVYQSKGYAKPWDGTYNGHELPVATYYYIINLNSIYNTTRYSGSITLIR